MVEAANYFKKTSEAACFFLKLDEEPRMGANGLNHETHEIHEKKNQNHEWTRMYTNGLSHEWARMG